MLCTMALMALVLFQASLSGSGHALGLLARYRGTVERGGVVGRGRYPGVSLLRGASLAMVGLCAGDC